jgi:hypothetical protein
MTWAKPLLFAAMVASCFAQDSSTAKEIDAVYPEAYALYLDLHQNPGLSSHETRTAAKLASQLRALGYDVTEHVGGTGTVAILKNGSGPKLCFARNWTRFQSKKRLGLLTKAKSAPKTTRDAMFPSYMPADTIYTWRPSSEPRR